MRNWLYYHLKPLLPWSVRLGIRRPWARLVRRLSKETWPILESAGRKPDGWPGWPDGKQFAFVLTHDVEGQVGLERVKALAELEMQLGFRSCFNFIPEGEYRVPLALRSWLVDHGFEVGVHDLYHDGKLFSSREAFHQHAQKINHYLKKWNAVGFRAGFMHHNLEWQHDLEVQYDCSTFDTDPFEPQPDGVGTIFPFWVAAPTAPKAESRKQKAESRNQETGGRSQGAEAGGQNAKLETQNSELSSAPARNSKLETRNSKLDSPQSPTSAFSLQPSAFSPRGYVELPYTLPQDSTLFLLFREASPAIWTEKLDWIAGRGGMALVNVHPDFLSFDGRAQGVRSYPSSFYQEFLRHTADKYRQNFWHALPGDLARFASSVSPRTPRRVPRRIGMVTHSYYETDNRVMRYASTLVERGDVVDVFSLRRKPEDADVETLSGVNVFRIQDRHAKNERSKLSYLWPVIRFLWTASRKLSQHHRQCHYDLVHVHNVPDFLVFAAWRPRLSGAKIILDIHDIVPEFYASKFSAEMGSLAIRTLKWLERISASFADHIILANHLWLDKYTARSASQSKISVFVNHVDSRVFHPRPRTRQDDRLIVVFPGGLQWHQGLDIAIRAFRKVADTLPKAELHIYGDGNMKPSLAALAKEMALNGHIQFFDPVPVHAVAALMSEADLGVVPKRADSFGDEAYSTKIMEFMSLGVPVVVSNTKIDRYYFNDSVVRFFESGSPDAMAEAMIQMLSDRSRREQMVACASQYVVSNCWEARRQAYLTLVDELCSPKANQS